MNIFSWMIKMLQIIGLFIKVSKLRCNLATTSSKLLIWLLNDKSKLKWMFICTSYLSCIYFIPKTINNSVKQTYKRPFLNKFENVQITKQTVVSMMQQLKIQPRTFTDKIPPTEKKRKCNISKRNFLSARCWQAKVTAVGQQSRLSVNSSVTNGTFFISYK